jgi:uncharacterized protein (TIGR02145 family)
MIKKIIIPALVAGTLLVSCKKSTTTPQPKTPLQSTIDEHVVITDSVIIGTQTWTSVNYNGDGGINYNNSKTNTPAYGKLYTQAEANTLILPKGWRLPTTDDFNKLYHYLGANSINVNGNYLATEDVVETLMSKTGWITAVGTNSSGFNAIPVGFYSDGSFEEGTGSSPNYVTALFATSSTFTGTGGGNADFFIYQATVNNTYMLAAVTTSLNTGPTARASLRFVKNN